MALVTMSAVGAGMSTATASSHAVSASSAVHPRKAVTIRSDITPKNIAPSPDFLSSCTSASISASCLSSELAAINNARQAEGVVPITISLSGFTSLTPAEQVLALTDLERTARGLAPVAALTAELDNVAAAGSSASVDPSLAGWTLTGNKEVTAWASNWAGGLDVLGADYLWMYDDGVGYNVDCPNATSPGCWGHRDNVLFAAPTAASCAANNGQATLLMGASVISNAYHGGSGIAEIVVRSCGGTPSDAGFTWRAAKRILFPATA